MKREVAEHLNTALSSMISNLMKLDAYVQKHEAEEEAKKLRRVLATLVATIDLDVLQLVYEEYPELKPEGLEG